MPTRRLHCSLHSELVLLFLSVLGVEHEMAHALNSWSPASGATLTGCGDLEGGVPTGETHSSLFLQRKSLVPSLSLSLRFCLQQFPYPCILITQRPRLYLFSPKGDLGIIE